MVSLLALPIRSNHRELRIGYSCSAAASQLAGFLSALSKRFRKRDSPSGPTMEHGKWLDDAQARNPGGPIWKLCALSNGVLQSECRVRWAERALALITNRETVGGKKNND